MEIINFGDFFLTEDIGELVAACCAAVPEFGDVLKDITNPFFKSSYADLANYIEATRGPLAKQGVFLFQGLGMLNGIPSVTTMLAHKSNQKLGFTFPMQAAKDDAQGIGSVISYDRRYSYGPATNTTGEVDDDGNAAVASREEHLKKLDQQMEGQQRITAPQVKAFEKACADNGRTADQIKQFLDELNGYVQVIEVKKSDFQTAIKWALNQPKDDDLIGDLEPSLQQARLRKIYAIAEKKRISKDDLHQLADESYKKKSLNDLTQKQFNEFVKYLESLNPAG